MVSFLLAIAAVDHEYVRGYKDGTICDNYTPAAIGASLTLVLLLRIWDLFSVIAHGLDTWGAADIVRTLIAPFRRSTASRSSAA